MERKPKYVDLDTEGGNEKIADGEPIPQNYNYPPLPNAYIVYQDTNQITSIPQQINNNYQNQSPLPPVYSVNMNNPGNLQMNPVYPPNMQGSNYNYPSQPINPINNAYPPMQQVPVTGNDCYFYNPETNLITQVARVPQVRNSQTLYCQVCKKGVDSRVHFEPGTGTYIVGGGLLLCGLWMGCCLIPFCIDDCKDAVHMCRGCGSVIGRQKFLMDQFK